MSSGGRTPLRLMETWRSLFYTPIYVSVAGGFLENEGLDVEFSTCPPEFANPLIALRDDGADIVQSGIMRSIIALDWGAETAPLHFAKINARDGFFILGRTPQDPFDWESLRGGRVIPVGFSVMPWASFQYALRRHGIEPSELDMLTGLSLPDAVAAFREGKAEFIHVAEPTASQLIADGTGHLWQPWDRITATWPIARSPPPTGTWRPRPIPWPASPPGSPGRSSGSRPTMPGRLLARPRNSSRKRTENYWLHP